MIEESELIRNCQILMDATISFVRASGCYVEAKRMMGWDSEHFEVGKKSRVDPIPELMMDSLTAIEQAVHSGMGPGLAEEFVRRMSQPEFKRHLHGVLDGDRLVFTGNLPFTEETCPGHTAMDGNPKVCRHCGTHIDSLHDRDDDDGA